MPIAERGATLASHQANGSLCMERGCSVVATKPELRFQLLLDLDNHQAPGSEHHDGGSHSGPRAPSTLCTYNPARHIVCSPSMHKLGHTPFTSLLWNG